jgi:L-ascorbate metabolism protein UlaG (beta-lactamase superfamily)
MTNKFYLKPNVLAEPLFNNWYAWPYLISPATAAMYIANSHLKVMQSFVSAPQFHISALKNPAMNGGSFLNYDESRVNEIKALVEETIQEQAHMIELANSIKTLDNVLLSQANGYSLQELYHQVPEGLKGYVELVYDLNNHPSIRFIEGLLYKSKYYQTSSQSIALSLISNDERPFMFSTPRLEEPGRLFINQPFNSDSLDKLFAMKNTPQELGYIKELLGVKDEDEELFLSYFTTEAPKKQSTYTGDDIRIRYFGHACVLIEYKGISVLSDPVISYEYENPVYRYTYADLPESIDYVVITHQHPDHCLPETLLQLRHKAKNIVVPKSNGGGLADPSLKLSLQNMGFTQVIEIDEMETINFDSGSIMGLPFLGEHSDLNIRSKMAYLVNFNGKSVMIGADSNAVDSTLYQNIHDVVGDIDALFIGIQCEGAPLSWVYGSLLTKSLPRKMDQSRQVDGSNYERATELINCLKPKEVYIYAMGYEPWLSFMMSVASAEDSLPSIESNKLVEDCHYRGIYAERLFGHKEILMK